MLVVQFILFYFFMSLLSEYLLKLVRQLTKKKFINLLVNGIGMDHLSTTGYPYGFMSILSRDYKFYQLANHVYIKSMFGYRLLLNAEN